MEPNEPTEPKAFKIEPNAFKMVPQAVVIREFLIGLPKDNEKAARAYLEYLVDLGLLDESVALLAKEITQV